VPEGFKLPRMSLPVRIGRLGLLGCAIALVALQSGCGGGARVHVHILGHSVEGRPIEAFEVGDTGSSFKELVVGCIHGNESAGIAVARRLEASEPSGIDLWILPVLNPDGRSADTRQNADGVDLNRNFPWRWRKLGGVYESGPHPLSEPESRIARRLILRVRPMISIWFHQHMNVVDESGGRLDVEQLFASLVEMQVARLAREPGSVVGWENHVLPGSTAFVVELPPGLLSPDRVGDYALAAVRLGEAHLGSMLQANGK
jgi:murein peptide amidase A